MHTYNQVLKAIIRRIESPSKEVCSRVMRSALANKNLTTPTIAVLMRVAEGKYYIIVSHLYYLLYSISL